MYKKQLPYPVTHIFIFLFFFHFEFKDAIKYTAMLSKFLHFLWKPFFPGQTSVPPRSRTWILDLSHDPILSEALVMQVLNSVMSRFRHWNPEVVLMPVLLPHVTTGFAGWQHVISHEKINVKRRLRRYQTVFSRPGAHFTNDFSIAIPIPNSIDIHPSLIQGVVKWPLWNITHITTAVLSLRNDMMPHIRVIMKPILYLNSITTGKSFANWALNTEWANYWLSAYSSKLTAYIHFAK